jgi:hypothetical protein
VNTAPVISLAEQRAARRGRQLPARPVHLHLVTPGESPPALRLEVFLRRARAVMDGEREGTLVEFPQRIA